MPKTPAWAEAITGVPAAVVVRLATEYATNKPAALIPGYGPGRTAYGEQYHRAAAVLAAITGNIGIHGGNPACCEAPAIGRSPGPNISSPTLIPVGTNPVEANNLSATGFNTNLNPRLRSTFAINLSHIWDALLEGTEGGFPADIKLLYIACANPLNQYPNVNKGVQALRKPEFIVVHEQFMTATAKFADVILPASTHWERTDVMRPWMGGNYFFFTDKVIDPLHQSKIGSADLH